MANITYEQFVAWCEYWGYTVDEGYKSMCFASNIIGQNLHNKTAYMNKCKERGFSESFLSLTKIYRDCAMALSSRYGRLEHEVFLMLERHDENVAHSDDDYRNIYFEEEDINA